MLSLLQQRCRCEARVQGPGDVLAVNTAALQLLQMPPRGELSWRMHARTVRTPAFAPRVRHDMRPRLHCFIRNDAQEAVEQVEGALGPSRRATCLLAFSAASRPTSQGAVAAVFGERDVPPEGQALTNKFGASPRAAVPLAGVHSSCRDMGRPETGREESGLTLGMRGRSRAAELCCLA